MKYRYAVSSLLLLLLASVFTFGVTIRRASADTYTTLSIPSFSKGPGDLGTTFTVPVQISNVSDLFGLDINITWDNTLITFQSLSNASLSTVWPQGWFEPLNVSQESSAGSARFAAVATGLPGYTNTGTTTLFTINFTVVKSGNFPYSTSIHFNTVKLSDHNANAITATLTDGSYSMSATVPDISFTLVNPNTAKPWEYGKYFEVQVYASDITSTLTGYDLKVDYTSDLLAFYSVYAWGALGTGTVDTSTPGVVHVSISSGTPNTGVSILLFTLTFQITFDDSIGHIWRTSNTGPLTASISLDMTYGTLTFQEGTLYVDGSGVTPITPPSTIAQPINLIKGDVECNGWVNILDLHTVAAYYGQSVPPAPAKYDLKTDGIIDIYDLVEIATNFNYYIPDSPPA
jgi:hypothetical protein